MIRPIIFLIFALSAKADVFSFVQVGDIHSSFAGAALNYYATNFFPWVLKNTNDGVFNISGILLAGDNYEDNRALTNNYDPAALATNGPLFNGSSYAAVQLTNDVRTISQSGLMILACTGNHDSDNTNGTASDWCDGVPTNAWNATFTPYMWTNQTFFSTNRLAGSYDNMVMKYQRGNIKLKFITYAVEPNNIAYPPITYSNQTAWVKQQVDSEPDWNCIVMSHFFLGQSSNSFFDVVPSYTDHSGSYSNLNIGPGNAIIEAGILKSPNILGFISGHDVPLLKGVYITNGVDGHKVFFVQFNQQQTSTKQNMNWVNVLTFDTVQSVVTCGTYTISTRQWIPDYSASNAFTNTFFPNNFRHTFQVALPIRPYMYPTSPR